MLYICTNCQQTSPTKLGKCYNCQEWNTFEEKKDEKVVKIFKNTKLHKLSDIKHDNQKRIKTGINELDRVLGDGLIMGSSILMGGEPGIGKSTLALQLSQKLSINHSVMYISAEESLSQIKSRSERLQISSNNLFILDDKELNQIFVHTEELKPEIIVVDSIHTLDSENTDTIPGSISQVRSITHSLTDYCKKKGLILILICHITKDGVIAGPKTLEHLVDTVLYFDHIDSDDLRLLRTTKNRYGPTNEIGIFKMESKGLLEINDSEEIFISKENDNSFGTSITTTIEGSRSILVEVQSLVSQPLQSYGKRFSNGIEINRLMMLVAIIEKFTRNKLSDKDVFINISQGLKIKETAIDMAILASLISSLKNIQISSDIVFLGEVGLNGEFKNISKMEKRISELNRLGFKNCALPSKFQNDSKNLPLKDIKFIFLKNIFELETFLGDKI